MLKNKHNEESAKVRRRIRKGDTVKVMAGNERGKTGTVIRCIGDKVVVQGLNLRKKHMKPQNNQRGQIITIERGIHISNLRPCTPEGVPVKLKVRVNEQGARELYYKNGEQIVPYRTLSKAN